MTRVAIYARYSSDLQTEASIEDQFRVADKRAQSEGWSIVDHYADYGVSGASMARSGMMKLMEDASNKKFDVLLTEALDRLSRDQENIAGIYKRIKFLGIRMITMSEGEINEMHIGLKGTMNALFLKDLADKTRRGLSGRVAKGKSGGGITYGYNTLKLYDDKGEPIRGEREVNQAEAKIVRRIFEEYAQGRSPLAIIKDLNKEKVRSPSGLGWVPNTLYGNRDRGTGILNNELYIGMLVWNKMRYIKDPDTGRRVSRPNPESQWQRTEVPNLRIIDQALWDKAKDMQGVIKKQSKNFWEQKRPTNLFSGLIKCGCCGGLFSKISATHLGCTAAKKKGTCNNQAIIRQDMLEQELLMALEKHLMEPELCQAFCDEYTRHINKLRSEHNNKIAGYKSEMVKVQKKIERIIRAVCEGW